MNQIIIITIVCIGVALVAALIISPSLIYVVSRTPFYELRFYKDGQFVKKKLHKQKTSDLTFDVMGIGTFVLPRTNEEYLSRGGICKEVYYDVRNVTPLVDKKRPPTIKLEDLFEEEDIPKDEEKRRKLQEVITAKAFTHFMNPKTLREVQKSNSIKKVIAQPMSSLENMKGIIILALIAVFGIIVLYMIMKGGSL